MKILTSTIRMASVLCLVVIAGCTQTPDASNNTNIGSQVDVDGNWIGSWSAAPYGPYPAGPVGDILPATFPLAGLTSPAALLLTRTRLDLDNWQ